MKYKFSIIIITKNEGSFLEQTVRGIVDEECQINYEILIVDDGSKDESLKFVAEWMNPSPLKVIRGSGLGVARARNAGAKIAQGQYLIFIDAHMLIDQGFLGKVNDTLEKSKINILGIRCNRSTDPPNYIPNILPIYGNEDISMFMNCWVYRHLKTSIIKVPFIIGACMIVKRNDFKKIGGFYTFIKDWGPEDRSFCLEAYLQGYDIYCDSNITIRHRFKKPTANRDQWFSLLYNSLACGYVLYDDNGFKDLLKHLKERKKFDLVKHPIYWLFLRDKPILSAIKEKVQKKRVRKYRDFLNDFSYLFPYLYNKL